LLNCSQPDPAAIDERGLARAHETDWRISSLTERWDAPRYGRRNRAGRHSSQSWQRLPQLPQGGLRKPAQRPFHDWDTNETPATLENRKTLKNRRIYTRMTSANGQY
jgi:hypothetical protein